MANFFKDNDDLQFYFDKAVDWDSLVRITEHEFSDSEGGGFGSTEEAVAFYRDILDMFGQFTAEDFDRAVAWYHRRNRTFGLVEAVG